MRRALSASLALSVVLGSVAAAGEREEAARKAAVNWLLVVDGGRYGESWDEAAEFFRKAMTRTQWVEALQKARAPLGKVRSRKLRSARFMTSVPGAPPGEYVVIEYETDFEHRSGGVERVTPMKDPYRAWRVAGYFIQ